MNKYVMTLCLIVISGCATTIPSKPVTLASEGGEFFNGTLDYDGPYSGVITVSDSSGESFAGRFTVVDRTAIKRSSTDLVMPSNNAIPGLGSSSTTETKGIDAEGFWFGKGSKGTSIKCTLLMGINGHGSGKCKSSNGDDYSITL
jgi:hypothetical protein